MLLPSEMVHPTVFCINITKVSVKSIAGMWAVTIQSVLRLGTKWTVRGSNPGRGENFLIRPHRP